MASIYKRRRRRPIPDGAEIITRKGQRFAVWNHPKTGRRQKAPLSDDGEAVLLESPGYMIQWFDATGRRRKKSTRCPDLDAARQLAAGLERQAMQRREGLIDPAQERYAQQAQRPLGEHLGDFVRFLTDRGNTPKHVAMTGRHVQWVSDKCGAKSLVDLTGPAVMRALGDLREAGSSLRTCNAYLASVKAFTRWSWKHKRAADDPLCGLQKYNVEVDRRWVRRALSAEEFTRLVAAAATGPPIQTLDGPTRAMLYILAAWTGFRRKELASLTLRSFDLEGSQPAVAINARHAKGRRADTVPLHPVVVDRLRAWLEMQGELHPDEPIFPLTTAGGGLRRTAKMMMLDLAAARARWIAEAATDQGRTEREASDFSTYQDADGLFADFHANRHTFVSNLERAGVSLTTAQKLARHSDPRLTANIYTHLGVSDRAAAIAALPAPPSTTPCAAEPGQQAVLGSDRDSARARWGQKWEQLNGEPEHTVASAGVAETGPADEPTRPNPLPLGTLGPCLPAVASAGASSGAGTRTPDTRIMIQTPAPVNPGRNGHFQKVGAVVGAVGPGIGAILAPDLQAVIAAWPALSDEARQRILEIIRRPRG